MLVETERRGRVLVVRMRREAKRNAVNPAMTVALDNALNAFEDDDDVWVGVLTGGPSVFSAGSDLREHAGEPTPRGGEYGMIRRHRVKPLIAAVEGPAFGGGMEMVLACDLVVASETARFGLPEVKRGVIATCGGLFRTAHALPLNVAKEILLTGDPIGPQRAYALGLVSEITAPGGALDAAVALAVRIVANSPISVRESLRAVRRVVTGDEDEAWTATTEALEQIGRHEDVAEGVSAFFERREPRWTGHRNSDKS